MAASPETKPSLLVRIRDHGDESSWLRFIEIYGPLVYAFLRKRGLQDADAADLTQDVMASVAAAIKSFNYERKLGTFRGWLFTVVQNRLRNYWRRQAQRLGGTGDTQAHQDLLEHPDPVNGEVDQWDLEHERHLFRYAAKQVRCDVRESTWQAFWRTAVEGQPSDQAADHLGMTVAAVHLAKGRVLARIKEQIYLLEGE